MVDESVKRVRQTGAFLLPHYERVTQRKYQGVEHAIQTYLESPSDPQISPNPLFLPGYYLEKNPDVAAAGVDPFTHFLFFGELEGRNPHPLISGPFLSAELNSTNRARQFSSNFGRFCQLALRGMFVDPNPLFSVADYLERAKFDTEQHLHPLLHYIEIGEEEGHAPGPDFGLQDYADRYHDGRLKGALIDYFERGQSLGHHHRPADNKQANVFAQARHSTSPSPYYEGPDLLAAEPQATALAYYLPQFHRDPVNDRAWGANYTEWTALAKAMPRFSGHRQPRIPQDLGYYDLLSPKIMEQQAEMARAAGISVFGIYYYWMSQAQPLRRAIELFRENKNIDIGYCLIWANESWSRTWDGLDNELILKQDYPEGFVEHLVDDWVRHFEDPRYFRICGKPVIVIYRALGIPNRDAMLDRFRTAVRRKTGEDLILIAALTSEMKHFESLAIDGLIEFPPHETFNYIPTVPQSRINFFDRLFAGKIFDYDEACRFSLSRQAPQHLPLIRTAVPCWDNEPRRTGWPTLLYGSTPEKYENWLAELVQRTQQDRFLGERIVAINAWNEWAEGAYLEPDGHFGHAYLNATARALAQCRLGTSLPPSGADIT